MKAASPRWKFFQGWQSLSDDNDFTKWKTTKAYGLDGRWVYQNNTISLVPGVGDLHTKATYENFELELEWKIESGGQSGIILTAAEGSSPAWKSGFRFQIADNAATGIDGSEKEYAGSCYHLVAASQRASLKAGEWNKVRIVKEGQHFQFFLNGVKTADFLANSKLIRRSISKSKTYSGIENFGNFRSGFICLEDRGSAVSFRKMKIRNLESFVNAEVDLQTTD